MSDDFSVRSPVGDRDKHWSTRMAKAALVLAPHIVAAARLDDLIPLIEADHRIQRVCTVPEDDASWPDVHEHLRGHGEIVLPWSQARRDDHDYGLILAGSNRGIDEVRGPVILVPHGGGLGQVRPYRAPAAREDDAPITGLHPDQLVRDGQIHADVIVLTHDRELDLLKSVCPEAVPHALVAGDIAFDRLVASLPFGDNYRSALDVPDDRELIVATTTWSPRSGFGHNPDMFRQILAAAPPDRFRVVAALHPQIWSQHGVRQVCGWLSASIEAGLGVLTPYGDWRGPVAGARCVMGDYTSVTAFAAGAGVPVLRLPHGDQQLLPGTPAAVLAEHAPLWDVNQPLVPQLHAAAAVQARGLGARIAELLTSRPGQAGAILRTAMYHQLGLTEPARALPRSPAPVPSLISWPATPLPQTDHAQATDKP